MLGCIVLGEENAFPVAFDTNLTIGHLKGAIKEQAGLAEPVHKLILWHVNIPENEKREIHVGINIEEKFGGKRKMVEDEDDEVRAKKERPQLLHEDKAKIQHLIKNLQNINTSDKVFTVPALPKSDTATTIFNRECYGYLRDFILNDIDDNGLNRYCITGNPGIGKSYFGILMLVELIKRNKSVLIDYEGFTARISPNGDILKVENDDRTLYRQIAEKKDVWCIIDSVMPKFNHDLIYGVLT
ncbi:hypothetical protein C1646_673495 [Rhizophagus diaphanus]|nr:hypothetical protein C1646_673495 [Rhizophagus diaphanus] [Rhizophagus sp. MUCL 43196]